MTRVPCDLVLQSCLGTVLHRLDSQLCNQAGPSCGNAVLPEWGIVNLKNRDKKVRCLLV